MYRKLTEREKRQFYKYELSIVKVANYIDENFKNKIIKYQSDNIFLELKFEVFHFMHLTGIKHKKGANEFFIQAKNNELNIDELMFKSDGTTKQKLIILEHIQKLLTNDIELLHGGATIKMKYNNAIRTKEFLMALMLKEVKGVSIPYSLFNITKKKDFKDGEKVKEIYSKCLKTGEITRIL